MNRFSPLRFGAELGGAVLSAAVVLATLVEPQWFERLFDEAPDAGDGSLEAGIAIVCAVVAGIFFARLARLEWRRRVPAADLRAER